MEFLSSIEAAKKWRVSDRQVQRLCADGRIPGAKKYGVSWMVPADADKPLDPRKVRKQQSVRLPAFFTLPRECPVMAESTLYARPGSGDEVTAALAGDPAAQQLFCAQLAYFRGEPIEAARLAEPLLAVKGRPDLHMGACFILCLSSMYAGDAAGWIQARNGFLQMARESSDAKTQRDFLLAAVDSGLYDKSSFPDWFRRGQFDPLPLDCYPLARHLYLKYLLLELGDPGISYMCGPLISQCRAEGALLPEIYCRLLAAIGFHDRGELALAAEQIDEAIALALPDRLYAPLVEERSELGLLLDERLSLVDKAAVRAVRELHKRLMSGWTILCRNIRGIEYAETLTQREHHAAKLAAKGLSNAEIAGRMGLSVNTVKRYIAEAVAKTGAADRTELAAFIALSGETLP